MLDGATREHFCDNLSRSLGTRLTAMQCTDPNPSPWDETPPHPPGEVLDSSNAKRINNLHVWPGEVHMRGLGLVPYRAMSWIPSERDGRTHSELSTLALRFLASMIQETQARMTMILFPARIPKIEPRNP
ncbi:hypothetical protein DY000_02017182 [Brassica cretica]|uniref:Uncharacterized protein n=1 Tax=Brassica cretica TaxID=69181 RepID=A0ABQ7CLQ0_BRACR|nr:hypothetical protein DY000_02017182 [Brassica cretica]